MNVLNELMRESSMRDEQCGEKNFAGLQHRMQVGGYVGVRESHRIGRDALASVWSQPDRSLRQRRAGTRIGPGMG